MCFCGTMVLRCTFFGLLLTAPLTLVKADDLQPPLPMSTGVVDAPPLGSGCTLPAAGPLQKSLLIVRDTTRTIGPYTVKLPGYATDPNDTAHDSYRPYLIRAKPGDSLRLDLANQMSVVTTNSNGDETAQNFVNTHFHGLVVSPRPYLPCDMPGDYIFDQLAPGQKFQYRIDIPKTVLGIGGAGRQPFPSGLYWFHSHLHGYSKDHLMAGQSGIIAIDPAPAAGSEPTDEDPTSAIRKGTDEQFLVLRDIQLGVPQGQTPDAPSAQGLSATWIHGEDYDTQACRQLLYPTTRNGNGFCSHQGLSTTTDLAWLFTVNGQLYPTITVARGRTQLWRVANVSATVAYTLVLLDGKTEQEMHLLSLDGVVAGTPDPVDPHRLHPSVAVKHILLMPASRAEILVENTNLGNSDKILVLHTNGLETGGIGQTATDRDSYIGDPWPAVDLASVILKGRGSATDLQQQLAQTFERSTAGAQMSPQSLSFGLKSEPTNCVTLPSSDKRRRITFDQDSALFMLGSEVLNPDGTSVDGNGSAKPHTIAPKPFQHAIPPQSDRHVCAKLGDQEVWELVNKTNELHNFHIHQTKFRLARHGDPGLPSDFQDGDAIVDPANVVKSQVPEFGTTAGVDKVDVWHDTLPVPPAKFDQSGNYISPGEAFVTIPFKDPVQVGTFVFHCHILEHEDKGMMATVEVYDPGHPGSSRQGAGAGAGPGTKLRTAFCGNPPTDFASIFDPPRDATWLDPLLNRARQSWQRSLLSNVIGRD
jgi:FtsP/CotA-like multicopper oxidase with cupredoxin domain